MIVFHGWVAISDSTYESDSNDVNLILEKINIYINEKRMLESPYFIKINPANGSYNLLLDGGGNHFYSTIKDVIQLYEYVGTIAKGSYGLLYFWNDEGLDNLENEFQVYVMRRGVVTKEKDPFLSPRNPTIED